MANEEHVALLVQGVPAWNAWRRENPNVLPDLGSTDLRRADLIEVNLSEADLGGAFLDEATLTRANLRGTKLFGAGLSDATLRGSFQNWRARRFATKKMHAL